MADRRVVQVRGTVALRGPDRSGSHEYDGALLRCGSGTSRAGGGGESTSVQGDQRVSEEDGPQRCRSAGAVSGKGPVAGGKNEAEAESGVDASGRDTRPAGKTTLGAEGQDQQPAGDAGDRVEAGSLVEQDCAGAGAGIAVSGMVQLELRILVEQIRALSESIAELDERLEEEGQQLPGYENLTSIKGIGSLSATVLLTVIGKISDFADENKLASYLGLVPKIANSNESERSGRITKQGNKLARTALVQCGLVAKRYSPYLQGFYERIKQRRGGGKAKIALARKLVKIVYDTLKNQWVFEDFPSFTLAA